MLRILKYGKRSQLAALFSEYNPERQTWLVSDLRTKFELQQRLLQERGFYADEAVLRASDLWRTLLKRLDPKIRDVNDSFIRSLLKSFLDKSADQLGVNSSSEESVFAYMNLLSSVHLHPEGPERLGEWFENYPESAGRWQEWALRSRVALNYLVKEHRVLSSKWIPAYLQKFNELEKVWDQDLIVDLGGEISRVEAELLRALSRRVNVTLLEPVPEWKKDFSYLLKPYADLEAQAQEVKTLPAVQDTAPANRVLRYSGMLAECKAAVGQIRQWLESGVAAEEISVIAPDIEIYWPVLQAFLEKEGVPAQKDVCGKLQGLPSMVRWLATLRSKSGRLSATDLEISFYESDPAQNLRYEEFKALFASLYAEEDLSRSQWIEKIYRSRQLKNDDILARDPFVETCMLEWSGGDNDPVQTVLRELLKNASENTQLRWKEWLGYLENIIAMKEYTIQKGRRDGIVVTKLMSAHSAKNGYRLFLGLSEEGLKKNSKVKLMSEDYFRLALDIGFYLENPDQSDLEFELRLLADSPAKANDFCFGATDFSGALQSPSSFWIDWKAKRGEMESLEHLSVPLETRWDELQKSALPAKKRIAQDLGTEALEPLVLEKPPRLSASALEEFLKCPFIFAAKKNFRLMDLPDVDLDVDHRTRGQLAHALFEKLTVEPMRFDWSTAEIEIILEEAREQKGLIFADERLWMPFKRKHVLIAQRFLAFEKDWRQRFPQTKTIVREGRFEFFLDPHEGRASATADEKFYRLSGQIDRIDRDQDGRLALIDYKSSSSSAYGASSWIPEGHIQLLLYMWVVEQGLIPGAQGEVIGLFYYIIKNFDRKKGFCLDEAAGTLFDPPKRKRKNQDQQTKEFYLRQLMDLLRQSVQRISSGEIHPQPRDIEDCKKCEWRRLCRAPHLN